VRKPNEKLDKFADWTRKNILEDELKTSQLPRTIDGGRKPTIKPIGWYGQPEIIESIFEVLLAVEKIELSVGVGWRNSHLNLTTCPN
jgi:hypothetical protein